MLSSHLLIHLLCPLWNWRIIEGINRLSDWILHDSLKSLFTRRHSISLSIKIIQYFSDIWNSFHLLYRAIIIIKCLLLHSSLYVTITKESLKTSFRGQVQDGKFVIPSLLCLHQILMAGSNSYSYLLSTR